jgi:hypothetical protein
VFWLIIYRFSFIRHSTLFKVTRMLYITAVKLYNSLTQANGAICLSACFVRKSGYYFPIHPAFSYNRQTDTQTTVLLI